MSVKSLMGAGTPALMAKNIMDSAGDGLKIGTTGGTAMAGNRTPTATIRGGVLLQPAIANADDPVDADTVNAILAALRSAGIVAT